MTKTIKDFLNDESKNETLLDTTKYGLKVFSEMLKESNGSIPKLKKSLTQSTKTNKSITNLDILSEVNEKNYMEVVHEFHFLVYNTADTLDFKQEELCPDGLTWPYAQSDKCIKN